MCYVAQDLAHFITNEQTFQSAYTPNLSTSTHALASLKMMAQFLTKLSHHTFYLLPLCFDAAARINLHETLLESFVVADLSVFVRLNSAMDLDNLGRIRLWLDEQKLPRDITTHYWFSALPKNIMGSFREIANSSTILEAFAKLFPSPAYRTIVIDSMNEVYVATLDTSKATSDNVFYSNHGMYILTERDE